MFLRRVRKTARDGVHTYFYDGWNLVLETIDRPGGATDRIEYVWGKDVSGTLQGAGGIGGLLYVKVNGAIYIPYYDAYGNILGYYDAAGNIVASYTYDAFGKTISSSGALADVFAFRYSTKYFDPETGLYYYGYRYYSPVLRRWLTRDPIEEEGGMNLYGFCENDAVSGLDRLGCARMLTRAMIPDVEAWFLGGEFEARSVLRYLYGTLALSVNNEGQKMYEVFVKDLAIANFDIVKDDVQKYSSDVYFIAHGTVEVDGALQLVRYDRKKDEIVRDVYDVNNNGRLLYLDTLGNKLDRQNTFGCYISPRTRTYDGNGRLLSAVPDDYRQMYKALLKRLKRYSLKTNDKSNCKKTVIIYEGEARGENYSTSEALQYRRICSEAYYESIKQNYNDSLGQYGKGD